MRKIVRIMQRAMIYLAVLLLVGAYPSMTVAAEEVSTTTSTTAPVAEASTPPVKPKPTYTYDDATGRWNTNAWTYSPATGTYEAAATPPSTPTSPAATIVTPTPTTADDKTQTQSQVGATTNTVAGTSITSAATSGGATVVKNGTAGSATTGDASSTASIINTVNSSVTAGDNQKAANFVADITGDVTGDIVLQPLLLKAMLEAKAPTTTATTNNQLTNNVDLSATSGNATVGSNTKAGSATSGSAHTVADVVNIINSMIAANQSFTGTINIYGNLNGDILIAPDFIPQLLASNGGTAGASAPQIVSASDTQSIVNNVSLAAASGEAAVLGNTSAGSAKTGTAKTNLVIFNLSGHEIVATNSLLVFVNVLGTWVGVILDAPVGTTAAAIGSGVTSNTATKPDLIVSADTNHQITNNINLQAQSGNALVARNTSAGDATSGDATASANIANISNSQIGLTGWFGILYINVFGNWFGSFGIDTPAGAVERQVATNQLTQPVAFVPHGTLGTPTRILPQPVTVIAPAADGVYHQAAMQPATLTAAKVVSTPQAAAAQTRTMVHLVPVANYRLPIAIGSMIVMGASIAGWRRLSAS